MSDSGSKTNKNNGHAVSRARARYLTQAIRLEEQGPPGVIIGAVFLTALLIVGGIVWASLTRVSETAHAPGEVAPAGLSVKVQHLEGGLVSKLNVKDGQRVSADEVLLEFHDTSLQAELGQMQVREAALNLQAERMAALLEKRKPDFTPYTDGYTDLADKQLTIFKAQKRAQENEHKVFASQIEQKQKELIRQTNQVESRKKEVKLLIEQVILRQKLSDDKLVAKTELLSSESRLAEAQSLLKQAEDGIAVAQLSVQEVKQRQLENETKFAKEIELEAGKVASELAEVKQTIVRIRDKIVRTIVKAPIDGIVQSLSISGGQTVVEPGQMILQIIPVHENLVVQARVSPTDIGHIRVGDRADIRVDSYDTARFGLLEGHVSTLSATTYLDEQRNPYYKAEISLNRTYLGAQDHRLRIIPGMTVNAAIRTGDKTLIEYLLRPIQRGLSNSFGER